MTTANEQMRQQWDGEEGARWAENIDRYVASSRRYTARLLEAAAIAVPERVLDVGCGGGESTVRAARAAAAGSALGVDLSSAMLERARERATARAVTNVRFEQADVQTHSFEPASFDMAMSQFGVMFFDDPAAAFANVRSALVSGGRIAFLAWRAVSENAWITATMSALAPLMPPPQPGAAPPDPTAPGPFSMADEAHVRGVLENAGFAEVALQRVDEQMNFGADVDDAVEFMKGSGMASALLRNASPDAARGAIDALRGTLAPYVTADGVWIGGGAWLVTARSG